MRITIIGLGLIGGSAALAWKQAHAEGRFPGGSLSITAVDTNPATLSLALERGIADRVTPSIAEGVLDADLVLLAVPVLAMGAVMKEVDRAAPVDAVITDAGSVRGSVITAVRLNARPERIRHYVPLHPIAGAEKAGLEFATPTLYRGATGVVTPLPESDLEDAAVVVDLWRAAGLTVVEMTPEEHDRIYAMVSHVPHMIAFALMDMAVSSPESRTALAAAGGGFRDTRPPTRACGQTSRGRTARPSSTASAALRPPSHISRGLWPPTTTRATGPISNARPRRAGRSTRACRPFRRASRAETQGRPETLHDNSEQFAPVRVQFMHCAPRVRFDRPRTETE